MGRFDRRKLDGHHTEDYEDEEILCSDCKEPDDYCECKDSIVDVVVCTLIAGSVITGLLYWFYQEMNRVISR